MMDRGEPWEEQLRQGLDALADLGDEQPPGVAPLQMLVLEVQREQRREHARELGLFCLCAAAVLTAGLSLLAGRPLSFLMFQGAAALVMMGGAVVWSRTRREVEEP